MLIWRERAGTIWEAGGNTKREWKVKKAILILSDQLIKPRPQAAGARSADQSSVCHWLPSRADIFPRALSFLRFFSNFFGLLIFWVSCFAFLCDHYGSKVAGCPQEGRFHLIVQVDGILPSIAQSKPGYCHSGRVRRGLFSQHAQGLIMKQWNLVWLLSL